MSSGISVHEIELPTYNNEQAWFGRDMANSSEWIYELTSDDVRELDDAVANVRRNAIGLTDLKREDFPLPALGAKLAEIRRDVLSGRGFALVRGWPSQQRTIEQSATAFLGVGTHLGEDLLSQNGRGHVLGHVANLGEDYTDPSTRGHRTSAELKFHADGGDIVGLLCIQRSRTGGLSRLSSSTTIWNELVRRRPDCARLLMEPYTWTRWGEIGKGQGPHFSIPVFQHVDGHVICIFSASAIEKGHSFEDVKPLSAEEKDALAMVNEVASDPAVCLDMDFQPGDMQFLCNFFILHSRSSYEDWPERERRRHLLRAWVSSSEGPTLPDNVTRIMQGSTPYGRPNGTAVPGVPRTAPMDPAG